MTCLKILSAIFAVGALNLAAAPAGAQDTKQQTVRIHMAELRTPAGRDGVMVMLHRVAQRVCRRDEDFHDLARNADVSACERKSLSDAIQDIGDPELAQAAHQRLSTPAVEVAEASKSRP